MINERHKRKETIGNNGFETSRRQNNQHFPYILLVIDEYTDIANKELNNALLELMKDGFKYGIHVILSTQRISGWVADIDFFKKGLSEELAVGGVWENKYRLFLNTLKKHSISLEDEMLIRFKNAIKN